MTVRTEDGVVFLEGACEAADAEELATALEASPKATVDLSQCRQLHSAVVQALLALRPEIEGLPPDQFLRQFVMPSLIGAAEDEPMISFNADGGPGLR